VLHWTEGRNTDWPEILMVDYKQQLLRFVFIGPRIVICSYSTANKMHLLSQIIYSCKTLYMFWTVFPSIIRSRKLRIQQRYMSNSCCYLLLSGMRWNAVVKRSTCFGRSFRPSSGAENCVYSNGICQTAAATCCYRGWDGTLLYTQFCAPDDGRKDRPKHVERFRRINNLR